MISKLGLNYNQHHACETDCILLRGETYERSTICHICGRSHFKENNVPKKILLHFPLAPWVRHFFHIPGLSKLMGLHSMYGSMDIVMHILTDCLVFKHIDNRWLEFKTNPKTRCRTRQCQPIFNVIIALSTCPMIVIVIPLVGYWTRPLVVST